MKTFLISFLLGLLAGGLVVNSLKRDGSPGESTTAPAATPAKPAPSDGASNVKDAIASKLREWNLTPEDIKNDLARTGQVVRSKAEVVGEKISDVRVVAVVKAKYVLDADLSVLDIGVDCQNGEVTLSGTVESPQLIGRAIMLALDTHGVHNVVSKLTVQTK